jgi:hypothetical protein
MRNITFWIAGHVFHVAGPFVYTGVTDGETIFFWIQTLWLLVVSMVAAAVWSAVDRRESYETLYKWFRLLIRLALASQMFEYGMTKVIPVQFRAPSLNILATPAADLSLETLLWTSIGAAPAYQIFTGCVEVLGGILLLVPRTTLLGALISLAALTQVFVLNMTYDIGLKLITFHLILLALFLIAPDMARLRDFFFGDGPAARQESPALFQSLRANRIALVAQVVLGVYLIGIQAYANVNFWYASGGGSERSPLYGIWNVEQLAVDGEVRPAVVNDYDRQWRRIIFETPSSMTIQRPDDSLARYNVSIDPYNHTLAVRKPRSRTWKADFTFQRPKPDEIVVDGEMDEHRIHAELRLVDPDSFRVLNSTFRWVRPVEN